MTTATTTTTPGAPTAILELASSLGAAGVTARNLAVATLGAPNGAPTPAQIAKARRRLVALERAGLLRCVPGRRGGGRDRTPTRWFITDSASSRHTVDAKRCAVDLLIFTVASGGWSALPADPPDCVTRAVAWSTACILAEYLQVQGIVGLPELERAAASLASLVVTK